MSYSQRRNDSSFREPYISNKLSLICPACQHGVLLNYITLRLFVSRLRIIQQFICIRRTKARNSRRPNEYFYAALRHNVAFYMLQNDLYPATVRQGATYFAHNAQEHLQRYRCSRNVQGCPIFYLNIEDRFRVIWILRLWGRRVRITLRSGILLRAVNHKFTYFWRNMEVAGTYETFEVYAKIYDVSFLKQCTL
jgi:hypothetical protein